MTRRLAFLGVLALLVSFSAAGVRVRAADDAAARGEDAPLKQLLLEALREVKALEDEAAGPGELELDEVIPGHDGTMSRASAMRAIGAALAAVGDRESAAAAWESGIDLASGIKRMETKAQALLDIAKAQDEAGEHGPAALTIQQAAQAARLLKEGGRRSIFLRSPFTPSPLEHKSTLFSSIGEIQARFDKAASEKSFRQAHEAAEAIEDHLDKLVALTKVVRREDPTGTRSAWDRPLELALAPRELLQRVLGLHVVLRERIDAGALEETVRLVLEDLEGVTRIHAFWVVTDELAAASNEGRTIPGPLVERLADAIKKAEFRRMTDRDNTLFRLSILQARCGSPGAAEETLELLKSDDPLRTLRLQVGRANVRCVVARGELKAGNRAAARGTVRGALDLLSVVKYDDPVFALVAEVLAETGDRDAALRAAAAASSSRSQVIALAGVATVLGKANDREGARTAFERASRLVDAITEESAWETNSREDENYNDPRESERRWALGFVRKVEALSTIAIAQAKSGDVEAAHKTVSSMLNAVPLPTSYLTDEHRDALYAIARIEIDAGDFVGAWNSCAMVQEEELMVNQERIRLLASIAAGQAAAGDARGAMKAALAQPSELSKLVALRGMAEGIGRRKSTRPAPVQ